jgi:hypothetical protein
MLFGGDGKTGSKTEKKLAIAMNSSEVLTTTMKKKEEKKKKGRDAYEK